MKRAGNLLDAVADWDNLRLAAVKALRGKRGKDDARLYVANLDANLHDSASRSAPTPSRSAVSTSSPSTTPRSV